MNRSRKNISQHASARFRETQTRNLLATRNALLPRFVIQRPIYQRSHETFQEREARLRDQEDKVLLELEEAKTQDDYTVINFQGQVGPGKKVFDATLKHKTLPDGSWVAEVFLKGHPSDQYNTGLLHAQLNASKEVGAFLKKEYCNEFSNPFGFWNIFQARFKSITMMIRCTNFKLLGTLPFHALRTTTSGFELLEEQGIEYKTKLDLVPYQERARLYTPTFFGSIYDDDDDDDISYFKDGTMNFFLFFLTKSAMDFWNTYHDVLIIDYSRTNGSDQFFVTTFYALTAIGLIFPVAYTVSRRGGVSNIEKGVDLFKAAVEKHEAAMNLICNGSSRYEGIPSCGGQVQEELV